VDERRHSGAKLRKTLSQSDSRREYLIGAFIGRLQVARRVFALGVHMLDHA